jgi:hypothetical protein
MKKLVVVTLTVFFCVLGYSQVSIADDNHAFPMLRMGVGARALAMGGAYTAVASDATAGYWNPAALAQVEKLSISTMIAANMANDRKYNYAALAYKFDWGAVAFSWLNAGTSDIEYGTTTKPAGGTFDANDHVFLFSYGTQMDKFFVGANFKVISSKIEEDYSNTGVGFDLGAKYNVDEKADLGVTVGDLGTKVGRNSVPVVFRIGGSVKPMEGFILPVELEKVQNRSNLKLRLGAEYSYAFATDYMGFLRGGVNDGNFAIGAGLKLMNQFVIDYAYVSENTDVFDENHRISLSFNWK